MERDKRGKYKNVYHSNFIPQVPIQIRDKNTQEYANLITSFESFNNFNNNIYQLRYIEFDINCQEKNISFDEITY